MKIWYQGSSQGTERTSEALIECLQAFQERSFYSTITMITEEKIRESIYEIGR